LLFLQNFDFSISYIPGKYNVISDCLSRLPVDEEVKDVSSKDLFESSEDFLEREPLEQVNAVILSFNNENRSRASPTDTDVKLQESPIWEYWKQEQKRDRTLSYLTQKYDLLDGVLVRKDEPKDSKAQVKIVVPTHLRKSIIALHHSTATSGHQGVAITIKKISSNFTWPNLQKNVQEYIQSCRICALYKPNTSAFNRLLQPNVTPSRPFEQISIDIVGPLKKTGKGHEYILTAICSFSRFAMASPLKDTTASTVVEKLFKDTFLKHGFPRFILTDNGSHFVNRLFREITSKLGCMHYLTIPYRPQSNGRIERFHRSLHNLIRTIMADAPFGGEWDEFLPYAVFAYNNSPRFEFPPPYVTLTGSYALDPVVSTIQPRTLDSGSKESVRVAEEYQLRRTQARELIQSLDAKTSQELEEKLLKLKGIQRFTPGERVLVRVPDAVVEKYGLRYKEAIVVRQTGLARYEIEMSGKNKKGNICRLVRSAHLRELQLDLTRGRMDAVHESMLELLQDTPEIPEEIPTHTIANPPKEEIDNKSGNPTETPVDPLNLDKPKKVTSQDVFTKSTCSADVFSEAVPNDPTPSDQAEVPLATNNRVLRDRSKIKARDRLVENF